MSAADPLEPLLSRLATLAETEADALETLRLLDLLEEDLGDDQELAERREAVKRALRTTIETAAQMEAFREMLETRLRGLEESDEPPI